MNAPSMGVRIPEFLQAEARRTTGQHDLGTAIRAGLQLLTECPPEKVEELLGAHSRPRGRPRKIRETS